MIIYGASGHGKVIKAVAISAGIKIQGYVDDNFSEETFLEVPLVTLESEHKLIFGIGDNAIRKRLALKFSDQWHTSIAHNTAIVHCKEPIGNGTVVMANAILNEAQSVGLHCIINTAAVVEHDCMLGDFVHISPNVTLSGGVTIKEGAHIGAGAVVIPGITIGKWAVIGAGTVVIENVPDYAVVVGNPGRVIKMNTGA